ncbi:unnamed protein product [Protopolystoma xenopodis]|uniref:Uncharacterized protein n=1 Tax=Protopolystoma xenopodis TaxID=117903 RepID=A0A3S5CCE0_9PLAT|nr:unnamed protein product [Protopolystoma xenopodis]
MTNCMMQQNGLSCFTDGNYLSPQPQSDEPGSIANLVLTEKLISNAILEPRIVKSNHIGSYLKSLQKSEYCNPVVSKTRDLGVPGGPFKLHDNQSVLRMCPQIVSSSTSSLTMEANCTMARKSLLSDKGFAKTKSTGSAGVGYNNIRSCASRIATQQDLSRQHPIFTFHHQQGTPVRPQHSLERSQNDQTPSDSNNPILRSQTYNFEAVPQNLSDTSVIRRELSKFGSNHCKLLQNENIDIKNGGSKHARTAIRETNISRYVDRPVIPTENFTPYISRLTSAVLGGRNYSSAYAIKSTGRKLA